MPGWWRRKYQDTLDTIAQIIIKRVGEEAWAIDNETKQVIAHGTDHAEVIQRAIDYVGSLGGGMVYLMSGTYNVDKTILVKYSNIVLAGDKGTWIKTIPSDQRTDSAIVLYDYNGNPISVRATILVFGPDSDVENIIIRGLNIDAGGGPIYSVTGVVTNGINIAGGVRNVVVENVYIRNAADLNIAVFGQVKRGETIVKSRNIVIRNNISESPGRDGIACDDKHEDIHIIGNKIINAPDFGIGFARNIGYVSIVDNYIYCDDICKVGIFTRLLGKALIANNYIRGVEVGIEEPFAVQNCYHLIIGNYIVDTQVGIARGNGFIIGNHIRAYKAGLIDVGGYIKNNYIYVEFSGYNGENSSSGYATNNYYVGGALQFGITSTSLSPKLIEGNVIIAPDISADPTRQSWVIYFSTQAGDYTPTTIIRRNYMSGGRLVEEVTIANTVYEDNVFDNILEFVFKTTDIKRNRGYATEASGVVTLSAGSTRVTVSHGLAGTPTRVLVTPYGNARVWVENINDTSFDIVTDTAPSSDIQVAWYAEV